MLRRSIISASDAYFILVCNPSRAGIMPPGSVFICMDFPEAAEAFVTFEDNENETV